MLNCYSYAFDTDTRSCIVEVSKVSELKFTLSVCCWENLSDVEAFDHNKLLIIRVQTHNKKIVLDSSTPMSTSLMLSKTMSLLKCLTCTHHSSIKIY